MSPVKRTFTLPAPILEEFERQVSPDERNALLAELLDKWLKKQKRDHLRMQVIQGCREMADVYLEVEREFHSLEEEVQRGMDSTPKARRRRTRAARSGDRV